MLSATDKDLLTKTGAGTPMGDSFRRFWVPVTRARAISAPASSPPRRRMARRTPCARAARRPTGPSPSPTWWPRASVIPSAVSAAARSTR